MAMTRKTGISKGGPFREARTENHHIVRVDKDANSTWSWKVTLKRRKKYIHKYFTDTVHGGKKQALVAAKAWRDRLMAEISDADYVVWRRNRMQGRNQSGVVGVGRYIKRDTGRERPYWQAFWHDADGNRQTCQFGVLKHGERGAKALACAARLKAMEEVRKELIRRGIVYGA
jgi:AP2 domain